MGQKGGAYSSHPKGIIANDKPIDVVPETKSGKKTNEDTVKGRVFHKKDATLEESEFKLVVELMWPENGQRRACGIDLVVILDVSGSMEGQKMEKLRSAMKFLIKKLSTNDNLSVIKFNHKAEELWPLKKVNKNTRPNMEKQIDHQRAKGGTDFIAGLHMGLQVLEYRDETYDRTSAIMLLSDGRQSPGCGFILSSDEQQNTYLRGLPLDRVPVLTFGLGEDHDAKVLKLIAEKSRNGTYSAVDVEGRDAASLIVAFSTCLAGLLTEMVQDLDLTISSKMQITKVFTGTYQQHSTNHDSSVAVSFGNLYSGERRRVRVHLRLPAVKNPTTSVEVLEINYTFRRSGKNEPSSSRNRTNVTLTRTYSPMSPQCKEVAIEEARQETLDNIAEAISLATKGEFERTRTRLKEAHTTLDNLDNDDNVIITGLRCDVQELQNVLKDEDSFERRGYAFGLASKLAHSLQRFAVRGDAAAIKLVAYATPLATVLAKQARGFDKDCTVPVPTVEQDMDNLAKAIRNKPTVKPRKRNAVANTTSVPVNPGNERRPEHENHIVKKVEEVSYYAGTLRPHFEEVTKCLRALLSMVSALQAVVIGTIMFWTFIKDKL